MRPFVISFATLCFCTLTSATFSLDISGPDWSYTTKNGLSKTTSESCKNAYSANIDCDPTLVGLAASMRPAFDPTPTDLDNTCVPTCKDALETYVKGVKEACTAPGDSVRENPDGTPADSVETVGMLFQYVLTSSCRKDSDGTYCYGKRLNNSGDFPCNDVCTGGFYQIAHDLPTSSRSFIGYTLSLRGEWWAKAFLRGWQRLQTCGKAVNNGSASSLSTNTAASTVEASAAPSTTTSAVGTDTATANSNQSESSSLTPSSSPTAANESPTASASSGWSLQAGTFTILMLLGMIHTSFLV